SKDSTCDLAGDIVSDSDSTAVAAPLTLLKRVGGSASSSSGSVTVKDLAVAKMEEQRAAAAEGQNTCTTPSSVVPLPATQNNAAKPTTATAPKFPSSPFPKNPAAMAAAAEASFPPPRPAPPRGGSFERTIEILPRLTYGIDGAFGVRAK
ncbi:unnamed protein product, partial [Amoebophrya sp. A120]